MKYRLELTDTQLNIVLRAVNLMMRTGMGQTDDLTEWLVTMGDNIKFDTSTENGKHVFEDYYSTREAIRPVIHGVMMGCWRGSNKQKSDTVLELETLYQALRHQEWLDTDERFESDVRSREPMQWGNEPVPKIERIGGTFAVPLNISPVTGVCKCEFVFEKSDADEFMEWFKTEGKDSFQRWRCGVRDLTAHDTKGENNGSIQVEND